MLKAASFDNQAAEEPVLQRDGCVFWWTFNYITHAPFDERHPSASVRLLEPIPFMALYELKSGKYDEIRR